MRNFLLFLSFNFSFLQFVFTKSEFYKKSLSQDLFFKLKKLFPSIKKKKKIRIWVENTFFMKKEMLYINA